ncbi:MAG: hypothetical protein H6Q67_1270 [Firmicutes bacterium]|nr:hypothetical protein [Bacillota bacterium]
MDREDTDKPAANAETAKTSAPTPQPEGVRLGNEIIIYVMVILQDLLVEQLINPVTNFNQIIALSTVLAALNTSIKPAP